MIVKGKKREDLDRKEKDKQTQISLTSPSLQHYNRKYSLINICIVEVNNDGGPVLLRSLKRVAHPRGWQRR